MNTMRSRYRQAAGALLPAALCLLAAGCGLGRGADRATTASGDFSEQSFFAIPAMAGVGAVYDIYRVTPDQGPLAGGDRARLDGAFPNPIGAAELVAVTQIYTVYFGYNIAPYDFGAPPTMSSALIYVTVPAGDAPGLVDVIFRDSTTQLDAATLYYGYEYLDPFDITGVVPELGPIAGGQQVTVFGRFPILAPMSTIAEAYGAYRVYFDSRPAGFDSSFSPVITAGAMYVITPPGLPPNAPGLVNVSVWSVETPVKIRVLPLGYEYIGDLDLTSVTPDRGFIFGDEPVTLGGTFPVSTPFSNALISSQASLYYTAYFGYRIAPFDQTVPTPVITPTQMLLRSPPAAAAGFVDVRVQKATDPRIADTLARAYRYYALYITDVIPDNGPVGGGTQVKIEGLFPVFDTITSLAEANLYYTVLFDGNVAAFDSTRNPIILPSQIDTINRTYTTGHMHVIAPPGAAPGFVDVEIRDNLDIDLPAICPDCYEYIGDLDLTSVTPDRGFIFGDEPVTLGGTFPVSTPFSNALISSQASLYYTAYFGYRIAPFDQTVPTPVITPTQMLLRSPPAAAAGFVDVRVQEATNPRIADTLTRAFRYYALYITDVIPDNGRVGGYTQVKIEGLFPVFDTITSLAEANLYYTVLFDGNVAAFDSTRNPIILPSQIDTINRTYTTGHMHVLAPPGAAPGFVDVSIEDNLDIDLPAICPDCYEYTGGDTISEWTTTVVSPNPVGKLEAGELLVRIEGRGKMTNADADPVFIVPQGGDPDQTGDRIELKTRSYNEPPEPPDPTFDWEWEGTNKNAIPRKLSNGLLVDGHAAVYILEASGDILGDDTGEPGDDGGVIQLDARDGRHFLIDTVPPRLQLELVDPIERLRGDDFVDRNFAGGIWIVNELDTSAVIPQDFPHPYDVSGLTGTANGFYDAPFDGNWMQRGDFPDSKAQVFFNVSSLTNNFEYSAPDASGVPTANLRFTLRVTFEDVNIYTVMGMDPTEIDAGRNADFFGGSTERQVAGFTENLDVSRPVPPPPGQLPAVLSRDEALTSGDEVLIQWDFQSTPFRLPEFEGVSVEYSSGGPLAASGNTGLSPNLAATPTLLFGIFDIGDQILPIDAMTGVQLDEAGVRTMMSVVFRAVDRAGDYTPRRPQSNETPGTKKLYTRNDTRSVESGGYAPEQQPEVGPLNLWWLRTTATRLISNIPASGDTRAPSFSWENTGEPDPGAFPDPGDPSDPSDDVGSERLYSFGIYRSIEPNDLGPYPTRDEQRDGTYWLVVPWSDWTNQSALTASQVQTLIQANVLDEITEGVWFMLVAMSVDEAGNLELWPEDQLTFASPPALGPQVIDAVDDSGGAEERNWDRWFVPPSGEAVDTRIEPFYWHDSRDLANSVPFDRAWQTNVEPSFGDAEVIPYPPRSAFDPNPDVLTGIFTQRVSAQFRITMIAEQGGANVEYELLENGQSVLLSTALPAYPAYIVGDTFSLVVPIDVDTTYLGVASRQPTYYMFRARTFTFEDADGDGAFDPGETVIATDASPATVQFVVVDNVANFIQNRKSEDTQPIQEMDRP